MRSRKKRRRHDLWWMYGGPGGDYYVVESMPNIFGEERDPRTDWYANENRADPIPFPGLSDCIDGYASNPLGWHSSHANTLPNCVGLAWGAFNETYYETMKIKGNPVERKFHYRVYGDAKNIIAEAQRKGYQTLPPSAKPPLGGLIVWGGTKNHVAYISAVPNNDTIVVQQSGYNSSVKSALEHYDIDDQSQWLWHRTSYTRNQGGTNVWGYGGTCMGFLVNPAISPQ